jgi:branched-chain amino acid transport system permease protein
MKKYIPIMVFFVCGAIFSMVADNYWLDIMVFALWYAYLCVTWNIIGGVGGQFTFAHPVYVAIGGYTSSLLFNHLGVSPWLGMFLGMALAALLAMLLGWINYRRRLPHLTFALITLAITFVAIIVLRSSHFLGGSEGIFLQRGNDPLTFRFFNKQVYFWIILGATCLVLVFVTWFSRSMTGFKLIALRDNEDAAAMLGIDQLKMAMMFSAISAALGAFGGTFYAQYLFVIDPTVASSHLAVEIILFTAIGGMGTVWGPVLGPLAMVVLIRYLNAEFVNISGLGQVVYGVIIIVVLVVLKDGVVSWGGRKLAQQTSKLKIREQRQ